LKPSASGDDEKPFSVLNNAVFLDIFILLFSCWLPKSLKVIIGLSKVTCGAAGAQCTVSCRRNWQMH